MGGWWMSVRASTIAIAMIGLAEALAAPASAQLQGQTIRIAIGAPLTGGAATFGVEIDRKSTRLNSSHLVISYAVFCLKKKKRDGWGLVSVLYVLFSHTMHIL